MTKLSTPEEEMLKTPPFPPPPVPKSPEPPKQFVPRWASIINLPIELNLAVAAASSSLQDPTMIKP